MEKQLNPIDGDEDGVGFGGGGGCLEGSEGGSVSGPLPVCFPPGDTNVSFEQFVDSLLSTWPTRSQTGSIFWTLGIPDTRRGHQCVMRWSSSQKFICTRKTWTYFYSFSNLTSLEKDTHFYIYIYLFIYFLHLTSDWRSGHLSVRFVFTAWPRAVWLWVWARLWPLPNPGPAKRQNILPSQD